MTEYNRIFCKDTVQVFKMVIIKVENLALLKGYDYAMRENFWQYSATRPTMKALLVL